MFSLVGGFIKLHVLGSHHEAWGQNFARYPSSAFHNGWFHSMVLAASHQILWYHLNSAIGMKVHAFVD